MHSRLSRAAAAVVATLLLSSCGSDKQPSEKEPERADVFHGSDVPHGSSGSVVAVSDGEIVECRGWGESDLETGTPAGCDTVYDIGSVTKQFTAAAVVKLQMQGRLRVTDSLGDYFAGVPTDKRDITVQPPAHPHGGPGGRPRRRLRPVGAAGHDPPLPWPPT